MPLKVTENAWVKVAPQPQRRRKRVDPIEQKEAMCAPLRYFSCTPMGPKDRTRMLSRPGMLAIEGAPSPVDNDERAGLMFSNGSHGGSNGGRRSRRLDRIASEPVKVLDRGPSIYEADEQQDEEEIVEVIEELSTVADDTKSHRSYRSHRSHCCQHSRPSAHGVSSRHNEPDPIPTPTPATRSFSPPPPSVAGYKPHRHRHRDDYSHSYSDIQSTRSASPPASIASHKIRHREREPLPPPTLPPSQARTPYRTVSTPAAAPRPTTRTRLPDHNPNGYRFESAIFQPRTSSNHYRDVYRGRGSQMGSEGGRWASATSALSFD